MRVMRAVHPDTALLDWLGTWASSIEYDDVTREHRVRSREPGYPAGRGRTLRAAATAAMRGAEASDAAAAHRRYIARESARFQTTLPLPIPG